MKAPALNLSAKVAGRIAALDSALSIRPRDGIAQVVLQNVISDLKTGDYGLVMGGWNFDDQEAASASASIRALADRWKAEDVMELA